MNFPSELKYTKTHEWIRKEERTYTVGITDYAQHEISDVVFVELPRVGETVEQGKTVSIVESVKAAFDIYAPVSGTIKAINTLLESDPAIVNKDPYQKGWFFEIVPTKPEESESLLRKDEYEQMIRHGAER
ncbi:MAG: glycine cleavage system protein H [Omnitrophica bacterium RIFCSPLOWO2_12_FULL_50_11]|nr:MAG: glycine cleavage system protein H [Omnitrophica bacterium RIFCSPLOWO2_12_FULL_50_11]